MFAKKDVTEGFQEYKIFDFDNYAKEVEAEPEGEETDEQAESVKERQQTAKEKIQEMIDRLDNQEFTRFWP